MKYSSLPAPVLAKLLALEEQVEDLAQRSAKTTAGIEQARRRLSGSFSKPSEADDLNASLKQLLSDKPAIEMKLHAAQRTLSNAKSWLDSLPAGTVLELVEVKTDGRTLEEVRAKIKALETELAALNSAPSSDIEERFPRLRRRTGEADHHRRRQGREAACLLARRGLWSIRSQRTQGRGPEPLMKRYFTDLTRSTALLGLIEQRKIRRRSCRMC